MLIGVNHLAKTNKLYQSVLQELKSEITGGKYPLNSKLPTEEELSKSFNISRSTLRKVLQELKEDGFIESTKGSGSFIRNKNIIRYIPVIISGDDTNYRKTEILKGIQDYFNKVDFSSLPTFMDYSREKEAKLILELIGQGHKNFIVYPLASDSNPEFYQKMIQQGINFVFVDTLPDKITCDYVASCNYLGGYMATKKLIELGHKRIAFCSFLNLERVNTIKERFSGYLDALAQSGIDCPKDLIFIEEDLSNEELATKILNNCSNATAVFSASDELAFFIINKLPSMNMKLALCGFDNSLIAPSVRLASINQNFYEIGKNAAKLMYERILNPGKYYEHIYIPVSMFERDSLISADQVCY